jgi:hypothetical protein
MPKPRGADRRGTRLPAIPTPRERPTGRDAAFILAKMLHDVLPSGDAEIARRILQEDIIRSGGKRLSDKMRSLVDGGWLEAEPGTTPLDGYKYTLGARLTDDRALLSEWTAVATALHGPGGLLKGWMGRPCLAHGCLNPSGTLVLATLVRRTTPMPRADIASYMALFMSPRSAYYALSRLSEHGLAEGGRDAMWTASPDWSLHLAELEARGFDARKAKIKVRNVADRTAFRIGFGNTPELVALRQEFKGWPCCRCSRPSTEVEHFPPRAWGAPDDWYLAYPICTLCNKKTKRFIQIAGPPAPLKVVEATATPAFDAHRILERRVLQLRERFYRAVDSGDVTDAHLAAAKALAFFESVKGEDAVEPRLVGPTRSRIEIDNLIKTGTIVSVERLPDSSGQKPPKHLGVTTTDEPAPRRRRVGDGRKPGPN